MTEYIFSESSIRINLKRAAPHYSFRGLLHPMWHLREQEQNPQWGFLSRCRTCDFEKSSESLAGIISRYASWGGFTPFLLRW